MLAPQPINCPFCQAEIPRNTITGRKPFICPSCKKSLCISSFFYFRIPAVAGLLVSAGLGYAFGLRDVTLLIFSVVLWGPITAFIFGYLHLKFNPKIKEYYPDELNLSSRK
jgi:hypothetical protein